MEIGTKVMTVDGFVTGVVQEILDDGTVEVRVTTSTVDQTPYEIFVTVDDLIPDPS